MNTGATESAGRIHRPASTTFARLLKVRVYAVLAAALAPVLLVTVPAQAFVDVSKLKPPIRIPSSVLGSLDSATQAERIAAVSKVNTAAKVAGGGIATTGSATLGVPALGVAISGFTVGYAIGTFALSKTPWAPEPSYVPNTDAPPGPGDGHAATNSWADKNGVAGNINIIFSEIGSFSGSGEYRIVTTVAPGTTISPSAAYEITFAVRCNNGSSYTAGGFSIDAANPGPTTSSDYRSILTAATSYCVSRDGGPSGITVYESLPGGTYPIRTSSPFADAAPSDPERQFKVVFQCRNTEGDLTDGDVVYSARFKETDPTWPSVPDAVCEAGALDSLHVTEITPDLDWDPKVILDWEAPTAVKDWQDEFPECGTGICELKLFRVPSGTTTKIDCYNNPDVCAGWFESPTKLDDYVCMYGSTEVALSECNVYSHVFDNTPTPDYADPIDGTQPEIGENPSSDCPPDFGLSVLTPWWWYKAATCALAWAFVPDPLTWQNNWNGVEESWGDNALGTLWDTSSDILTPFTRIGDDPTGTCEGFPLDLTVIGLGVIHPFSACDPVSQLLAPVSLALGNFSIYAGMILMSYRTILKNFGGETTVGE